MEFNEAILEIIGRWLYPWEIVHDIFKQTMKMDRVVWWTTVHGVLKGRTR